MVGEPGGHVVLLDENLTELARTEQNISKETTYAYDKATKTVYYTTQSNARELYSVKIENDSFSAPERAFTAENNIAAIGVNGAGDVAAVAVSSDFATATLVTDASGEFQELSLPSSQELIGQEDSRGSIWGSASYKENIELV